MASYPRYHIIQDGSTFHVTWQCHNHAWLLKEDWAKKLYYSLLLKFKSKYDIKIHSYSFMDNHPHLTGVMESKEKFSAFFRTVNSLFAKASNKHLARKGQVVMDRFKSPHIENDKYLLEVMIYIDLNPCRAGKVKHPKEYQYSSYGYYAYGKEDPLIDAPDIYLALGASKLSREKIYREMVEYVLRKDNHQKRHYSNVCFIGNAVWVIQKQKVLMSAMKRKKGIQKLKNFIPTFLIPST